MDQNGSGRGDAGSGLRWWIRRLARGEVGPGEPVVGKYGEKIIGDDTGEYLNVAGRIFRLDMGGRVPKSCEEVTQIVRHSGAVIEFRGDVPPFGGAHLGSHIYIDSRLSMTEGRRVLYQMWARFLCWRDRGGPSVSVYERETADDGFARVAGLFERIAAEADPVQPKREPTLY